MSMLLSSAATLRQFAGRLYSTAAAASPSPSASAAAAPAAPATAASQASTYAHIVHVRVPYFIHRTTLAKQLPVYPKYRYKGTQVSTIVRRIEGDGKALAKEIQAAHPDWTVYHNRNSNFIEVRGLHVAPLRDLLTAKGF